jgi:hypothetical protein
MSEFWKSTDGAPSDAELQHTIEKGLGRTGLMLFVEFDHGAIVRKGTGGATPRMIRFVIGNPLIVRRDQRRCPPGGWWSGSSVLLMMIATPNWSYVIEPAVIFLTPPLSRIAKISRLLD